MTRSEMIRYVMTAAREKAGVDETDPLYLGALRELKDCTDKDLHALVTGIKTGVIYDVARHA